MPKKKSTTVYKGPNPRNQRVSVKKAGTRTRNKKAGTAKASQRNSGAGWYTKPGHRQAG